MSVWPESSAGPSPLSSREGSLVSVSISIDPRQLEDLLEALAMIGFPINPQIYHDAAIVYGFADGHEESEGTTLVEFPAYEGRLDEVRLGLEAYGLDPASLRATAMLADIHAASLPEPAPPGAPYMSRRRVKHRAMAAVQ